MKKLALLSLLMLFYIASFAQAPPPITGNTHVCLGMTNAFNDAQPGGTWTSSNTAIATITQSAGVASGVSAGSCIISYNTSGGIAIISLTVDPLPIAFPVSGGGAYCAGGTGADIFTNNSETGTNYQLFDNNVVVGNILAGQTGNPVDFGPQFGVGNYTVEAINSVTGCNSMMSGSAMVSIAPLPTAYTVTGGGVSCGSPVNIGLSSSDINVTYQLYLNGVAVPGASQTGTGSALMFPPQTAAGNYTVMATSNTTTCTNTMSGSAMITVGAPPAPITGITLVCAGSTTSLFDATGGGGWSSSDMTAATVTATGVVSGVLPGNSTATIIYTMPNGCSATILVTVYAVPVATATQTTIPCSGGTATVTVSATGGQSPYSGTGSFPGVAVGPHNYLVTDMNGCANVANINVTAGAGITGPMSVCPGQSITLTGGAPGGSWTKTNNNVLFPSITNTQSIVVTGSTTSGTTVVSYTAGGCASTITITNNPLLPITTTPANATSICTGQTLTLGNATPPTGTGSWSTMYSYATIAGAGSGSPAVLTGVTPGIEIVTYTSSMGCQATKTITVKQTPVISSMFNSVCTGQTISMSADMPPGVWSKNNNDVTAPTPLTVQAITLTGSSTAGTTTVTYTAADGCATNITITNNALLPISPVTLRTVCVGQNISLNDLTLPLGGNWGGDAYASANQTGPGTADIHGIMPGTSVIYYNAVNGCQATATITVKQTPVISSMFNSVCTGQTISMSADMPPGAWSKNNNDITAPTPLTVQSITFTGSSTAGTTTVTYTAADGCATNITITNNALLPIYPTTLRTVCVGQTISLSDGTLPLGGFWSGDTYAQANQTGPGTADIYGVMPGTSILHYQALNGCLATATITVKQTPVISSMFNSVCTGQTISMSADMPPGLWSKNNNDVTATVLNLQSLTLTGSSTAGTTTVTYTSGGCAANITITNNVLLPIYPITLRTVCVGQTISLSDGTLPLGGFWSGDTYAQANQTGPGTADIYGVMPGTSILHYQALNGCLATATITVKQTPVISSMFNSVCTGQTISMSADMPPGLWSKNNNDVTATVLNLQSLTLTGSSTAGTTTVTYTSGGCAANITITNNVLLPIYPITLRTVCVGQTISLSDGTLPLGGFWSGDTYAQANQTGPGTADIYGVMPGTSILHYQALNGCLATATITVKQTPVISSMFNSVCTGQTISMSADMPPGLWSKNNNDVTATVLNLQSLTLTGSSTAGTTTVTYTSGGCSSAITITNNLLLPISPVTLRTVCVGQTISLNDLTPPLGGGWSGDPYAQANQTGAGTADIYGMMPGTSIIHYNAQNGCQATATITVKQTPVITAPVTSLCTSGSTVLTADMSPAATAWTKDFNFITLVPPLNLTSVTAHGTSTPGVTTVKYTASNGCASTVPITKDLCRTDNGSGATEVAPAEANVTTLELFPNPNSGSFTVKANITSSDNEVTLEVSDMLGHIVYQHTVPVSAGAINDQIQLNNNLAAGMYILNMHTNTERKMIRFVIRR